LACFGWDGLEIDLGVLRDAKIRVGMGIGSSRAGGLVGAFDLLRDAKIRVGMRFRSSRLWGGGRELDFARAGGLVGAGAYSIGVFLWSGCTSSSWRFWVAGGRAADRVENSNGGKHAD